MEIKEENCTQVPGEISRRDFLKLTGGFVLGSILPKVPEEILDIEEYKEIEFLKETPDEISSYSAILSASEYKYGQNSEEQFINNYLFHLGINTEPEDKDRFTKHISLNDIFTNRFIWKDIPPGTVLDIEESSSIYMGLNKDGSPIFSCFTRYSRNKPEIGVGLVDLKRKYIGTERDTDVALFDAVDCSRNFDTEGGDITPDLNLFKKLGYDITVVLNINDGSLSIWNISNGERINSERMFCAVGRRLKRNGFLSKDYLKNVWKHIPSSMYDSANGCHVEPGGIRRKSFTPPIITDFQGTIISNGFGGLGPDSNTDISLLKQIYRDESGKYIVSNKYSSYTLHEVPRGTTDQSILMREPQLIKANQNGIAIENPNLSAGCVNMDGITWKKLKDELLSYLKDGKRVSVMFTTPNTNQTSLLRQGSTNSHFHSEDPFGAKTGWWGYDSRDGIGLDMKDSYKGSVYRLFPNRL